MGRPEQRRQRKGQKVQECDSGVASSKEHLRATSEQTQLNRALCAAADRRDAEAVLDLVQAKQARMNLVNLSTAFHRLARLTVEDGLPCWDGQDPRAIALQWRIKLHLTQLSLAGNSEPHPRCLSTIAWACGRLQDYDAEVMHMISELAARWITLFKPFELANLLWGFAKLQIACTPLFRAAQDHICADMSSFSTRSISLVAWAFATARPQPCARLLRKAAEAFVAALDFADEKPVSIANLVWALATMAVHPKQEVLRDIGDAAASVLHNFKANELSITLWAFARLSCCHEALFAAAAVRLCHEKALRSDIHSQGIANILWAFARQATACSAGALATLACVLPSLLPTCLRLLPQLSPMEFSSVVSAVSKLATHWRTRSVAEQVLLAAAAGPGASAAFLAQFSNQAVANVLSAYGSFFESQPLASDACCVLMARLEQLCVERGVELEQQSVLAALWGPNPCDGTAELELAMEMTSSSGSTHAVAQPRMLALSPAACAAHAFQGPPPAHPQAPVGHPEEPAYVRPCRSFLEGLAALPPGAHVADMAACPGWGPAFVDVRDILTFPSVAAPGGSASSAPEPVTLSVIPEFSYLDAAEDEADTCVVIAFEVGSLADHKELIIIAEVCAQSEAKEHVTFPVDVEGMYKLSLPALEGIWEVRISACDPTGKVVAETLTLAFTGCHSAGMGWNEDAQGTFARHGGHPADSSDLVSTCASVDGTIGEASLNSEAADQDASANSIAWGSRPSSPSNPDKGRAACGHVGEESMAASCAGRGR